MGKNLSNLSSIITGFNKNNKIVELAVIIPVYNEVQTIDEIMLNDEQWYDDNGVKLHKGLEVTEIDRVNKKVIAADGTTEEYDRLLIATGSDPFIIPVPGNDLEGVMESDDKGKIEAKTKALAEERGVFKNFGKSVFKNRKTKRYRNATTTTIAPTGTLSILAGCSSGIEPLFALSFVRNVMDNDKLLEVNPLFEKVARKRGFYTKELMDRIASSGSIMKMEEIPEDIRNVFVTAHDVTSEWHIRMQAAFQKYTDNAVSKTVNLPHDATEADVQKVYDLAFELSCKGVTIYRDGSKKNQVLSIRKQQQKESTPIGGVQRRPDTLEGFTTRIKTGYGYLYVTVTEYDNKPFEVFATIGKSGRSTTAKTEAIGVSPMLLASADDPRTSQPAP